MKKILALTLMVCMLSGVCAAFAEGRTLGNDKAGYLHSDVMFYNFTNLDMSEEDAEAMFNQMGWVQYQCFDDSPLSGTVITLQGIPSAAAAGVEVEEYKQRVVDMVANAWGGEYVDPAIDFYRLQITEKTEVLLFFFMDQDTTSGVAPLTAAALCQEEGNYCVCLFEYMAETEEALRALMELLLTFEAGTELVG